MSYSVFVLGDPWPLLPDCGNVSVIVFPVPQHFISQTWPVLVIFNTHTHAHHFTPWIPALTAKLYLCFKIDVRGFSSLHDQGFFPPTSRLC